MRGSSSTCGTWETVILVFMCLLGSPCTTSVNGAKIKYASVHMQNISHSLNVMSDTPDAISNE